MAPEQQLEEAGKFYVKIVDRERVKKFMVDEVCRSDNYDQTCVSV